MYFKVTSSATLTATRTLTIAPNTISRVMWIENATTGSQSITISQGSGGNVTIPTGDVKVVYLDGAGSGAAVVDAFTNLNLADVSSLVATTVDINGGSIDGTIIGAASPAAGTFTTATATTGAITTVNSTTVNATTVDATSVEVTNVKAKDGTASATIADSTGVMTISSSVLTTADINGGTIDGTVIGGTTPAAINGTVVTGTTSGVFASDMTITAGSIVSASGAITFGNENLSTTGTLGAGVATLASSSTVGNLTLANGSITDSSGAISFGNENLSTTGTLAAGAGSSFGLAGTEGTAHIHTASAGAVTASTNGDDLVIENSAAAGLSLLTADNSYSSIYFGTPTNNIGGVIDWDYTTGVYRVGSNKVGGSHVLAGDALVTNLTLSGGSGSQQAVFAGSVTGTQMVVNVDNPDLTGWVITAGTGTNACAGKFTNTGGNLYVGLDNSAGSRLGGSYAGAFWHEGNYPLLFGTNNTERMRIDSSGRLLVGASSFTAYGTLNSYSNSSNPAARFVGGSSMGDGNIGMAVDKYSATNTTSQWFLGFSINNAGTAAGVITANGASQAAFGTWSDRRLKENIVDLPTQLDNILALRPVEFDYIESEGGGHQISFIAQEIEEVYPDAVGERPDGMKTLTGWDKTTARLVKAIQEQQAIIDDLKARIETLEGA